MKNDTRKNDLQAMYFLLEGILVPAEPAKVYYVQGEVLRPHNQIINVLAENLVQIALIRLCYGVLIFTFITVSVALIVVYGSK